MIKRIAILFSSALSLAPLTAGCSDVAPTVEVVKANPTSLDTSRDELDDLELHLAYTDPDGDLGGGEVVVHDCRAEGLVVRLPLPRIATPEGVAEGVSIEGELTVVVTDVGALVAAPEPAAACRELGIGAPAGGAQAICVVLVDAAGNESVGDCTEPITITTAP
jgi:hypothetical protein